MPRIDAASRRTGEPNHQTRYEELLRDHESETIVWKKRFEQTRKSKQLSDKTNLEVRPGIQPKVKSNIE